MKTLTTEAHVKQEVKKFLKKNNIYYFMPSAGIYGRRGVADFIACLAGRYIAIEAKAPDKGAEGRTALQEKEMSRVICAGGEYYCVYNWKTLEELFCKLTVRKMFDDSIMGYFNDS